MCAFFVLFDRLARVAYQPSIGSIGGKAPVLLRVRKPQVLLRVSSSPERHPYEGPPPFHRRCHRGGPQVAIPGHGHRHHHDASCTTPTWPPASGSVATPRPEDFSSCNLRASRGPLRVTPRASQKRAPQASTHPTGSDTRRRRARQGFPQRQSASGM